MPETYTQEQIHDIAQALYGWTALPRILPSAPGTGPDWDIGADIRAILSALSTAEKNNADWQEYNAELFHRAETAERERDAYRKASVEDYSKRNAAEAERDAALAQVAELEARLRGAADRGAYCLNQFEHDWIMLDGEVYVKHEAYLRAAIVGKKEG